MQCPNCGTENPEGTHFCSNCGAKLESQTVPEQPQTQPTEPVQPAQTQPLYSQVTESPAQPAQPTDQMPYQYGAPQPEPTQQTYQYGTPQPDQQSPYGSAPQPQPQSGQSYQAGYQPAPAQKKGPNKGLIIGIVAAVVVALVAVIAIGGKKGDEPAAPEPAPTEVSTDGSGSSDDEPASTDDQTDSTGEQTDSEDHSTAAYALAVSGDGVTLGDRVTDTTEGYGYSFCPLPGMTQEDTDGRLYCDSSDPYMVAIAFAGENSDGDDAEGWADWFANSNEDYADFDLLVMGADKTTFTLQGVTPDKDGDILVVRGLVNDDTVQLLCIYYKAADAGEVLPSVVAVADSFQAGTGTGND